MSVRRCVGTLQWVLARVRRTPPRWDLTGYSPPLEGIPANLSTSCGFLVDKPPRAEASWCSNNSFGEASLEGGWGCHVSKVHRDARPTRAY